MTDRIINTLYWSLLFTVGLPFLLIAAAFAMLFTDDLPEDVFMPGVYERIDLEA